MKEEEEEVIEALNERVTVLQELDGIICIESRTKNGTQGFLNSWLRREFI